MNQDHNQTSSQAKTDPNPFQGVADWLLTLSPLEFSALASAIGLLIAEGLPMPQVERLGIFLSDVAFTIITYASQFNFLSNQREQLELERRYEFVLQTLQKFQTQIDQIKVQNLNKKP